MIAGLLLAAGYSRRFGGDKLLAPLHGRPLIVWSAETIAAEVEALYVVVPAGDVARRAAVAALGPVVVEHERRDEGMASSIGAGVAALPGSVEAVIIALADQPLVAPEVIRRLRDRWRGGGVTAVAPRYRDGQGNPVLFGRPAFGALRQLGGDRGARAVLAGLGAAAAFLDVDDPMPIDVDTPEALRAAASLMATRR